MYQVGVPKGLSWVPILLNIFINDLKMRLNKHLANLWMTPLGGLVNSLDSRVGIQNDFDKLKNDLKSIFYIMSEGYKPLLRAHW